MARMGGKKHLKALAAPRFWPILRKEYKWAVKPSPGPHPTERCFPLLIVVRDILGYAKTAREARKLISEGHFKVDGRIRKNYKYPVGLMDVIEIVDTGQTYRVIPVPVKVLGLIEIDKEEAKYKLSRIENKTTVKGGHIQLNLHDGRNVLIKVGDPKNPVEDIYKTLGTLQITIPEQQILNYIPLEEGMLVIISGGRNVGRVGKVVSIHKGIRRHRSIVTIEDKHGNKFQTSLTYVFPIGKEEPLIKLPEGAW
ncbi:30S ribosomal protein S4e [Staphylothermus hellenicus]|uniref:Small ribosomal subunit protein eS4 n=1 Tax=Staphylothermus hellenicus (strain DSM 12710 / JCM 10830 / BK20S6-10-b1 / P8) TaxID=591019 RepID=D7D9S4_STAHD|nr:30S ribosomal protein S4e [Staphylothermus hellenicus]ADI32520.1 Ribosomal protein S4E, central domain protein [Staphylothermus hellenicus DSM 12710]